MKSELYKIFEKQRAIEKMELAQAEAAAQEDGRRGFLKKAALGGLALGGMMNASIEDIVAHTTSQVKKASAPSELKITDMRYAVVQNVGRTPIIRIDTNQGISGWGEVRDGGDERFALMLKSRILGQNPCNVEMLYKIIRQFGYHGRQGGGVSGVDMALWDLCGKAYGVPAWQLLGGRYRDKVRLYADTASPRDAAQFAKQMKDRMEVQGFTWLKMDLGIHLITDKDKGIVNNKFWNGAGGQYSMTSRDSNGQVMVDYMGYGLREHPFTQVQITDEGLDKLASFVEMVRDTVGYEIPLSSDHYGHFDINNHIRLGKRLEKYRLAWLEDATQWWDFDHWRTLSNAIETPTCTGEDTFGLRGPGQALGFKDIIDSKCVDIIHPDLATSGGLLETKRIGDYAQDNGIAMAMHMAGTPICFMSNVHCAAATENFLALEHHSVDSPWWEKMVKMTGKQPMITKGFANVPLDAPGLGIDVNLDVVKEHLHPSNTSFFVPTPEWDAMRSHDRLWS